MMNSGPIPMILEKQQPEGYWDRKDDIYYNKYTGTCWQVTMLSQMGADGNDDRIRKGCEYILTHGIGDHGGFSMNGRRS
ncbi:MAG: nitrogen fixation protein NifH, partial [Chloroflexi bacterium]|nr:nitrogen fixation protein NifH [Chloroflexota bacterium]